MFATKGGKGSACFLGRKWRTGLLSHSALASTVLLGGVFLASPVWGADATGTNGNNGSSETTAASIPTVGVDISGAITVSQPQIADVVGEDGGPGIPGAATPSGDGANAPDGGTGEDGGDANQPVNQGGSSIGTGGNGGYAGSANSGGVAPVTVDGGNFVGVSIDLEGDNSVGGAGGEGGDGLGSTAGSGGNGGQAGSINPNNFGGTGGDGAQSGVADGTGGTGGNGGSAIGGGIGAILVDASGTISNAVKITAVGGAGTGGKGGGGGRGEGGLAAVGGNGGLGSGAPIFVDGNTTLGGDGGIGGAGASAHGTGGEAGDGADGTGGDVGTITVTVGGAVGGGIIIESSGGVGKGGDGGAGGEGKGTAGGVGGNGGNGGTIFGITGTGNSNSAGNGGMGGAGGAANGTGGNAGDGGDGLGGSTGAITIGVAGNITGDIVIESIGGEATGGIGGKGGLGSGGASGAGGTGGQGGDIGNIDTGDDNIAGTGGQGGLGAASDGKGGNGGHGGDATGGDAGKVTINRTADTTGAIKVTATGAIATAGKGGDGGNGISKQAGTGGQGGAGGDVGTVSSGSGNIAGNGGLGGAGGSDPDGLAGNAGNGGHAQGGSAEVSITNSGNITTTGTDSINIKVTGGAATAGAGGLGGDATGGIGGTGGAGGAGGSGGNGDGDGVTGGKGGNAAGIVLAGNGGNGGNATGGSAKADVTNSGDINTTGGSAIVIVAAGGNAKSGAGGGGGTAQGGHGGGGGGGGIPDGNGGAGGNGSSAKAGDGGDGGWAKAGSTDVVVTNDGRLFADGNGIDITATSGTANVGAAGSAGTESAGLFGGGGASGGPGGTPGANGSSGNELDSFDGTDGDLNSAHGSSSITVNNNNLIDVDGIGIRALTSGADGQNGKITINNTGIVQGGLRGLDLTTDSAPSASGVTNFTKVNNSGLITADNLFAINAKGSSTLITNTGTVRGFLDLTGEFDLFHNQAGGIFEARGTSNFSLEGLLGEDVFTNDTGATVLSAVDAAGDEAVRFENLERFRNAGLISMVDGAAGDTLDMSRPGFGTIYEGVGGTLMVDALLAGPGTGLADQLIITGVTNGETKIAVNVVDVQGANTEGIEVVKVSTIGGTNATNFVLENGPINAGFFSWNLRFDDVNNWHELFSEGLNAGAYEFAAGITASQDIWYQTAGTLLQRQADLRPLLDGSQVTPVADYGEPVAPTPTAHVTPGFWFKGVGAYLEREEGEGTASTDRNQEIYGGLAGFDFGTESAGEAWLFGAFAGYLNSDLDFDQTNTQWTFEGPTVGIYASYLNRALHVDATLKADFLSVDIDAEDLAPDSGSADTDVFNIGGLIDAGYKLGWGGGGYIEPQASVAVVRTEIDDTDIFGGTVEFEDETSVRGRLGLRLGFDHTAGNQVVYSSDVTASVWQEFNGENDVSVLAPGLLTPLGTSDDPSETVGDVSIGFSVAAPDGWSGFIRGNYQFADDFDAIIGNAGLRYAW